MSDRTNNQPSTDIAKRPIRKIGDLPEIPRLKKLREDILKSPYHLCAQKASLTTQYFRENKRAGVFSKTLSAAHFKLFKKALEKARRGELQKQWQVKSGSLLNKLYLKLEGTSQTDNLVEFARALRHTLRNMPLTVYDHELIVGNPSSFRVGAPIHPDLGGLMTLPELDGLPTRDLNPILTDPEQTRELREEIFPFWFNRSVMALAPLYNDDPDMFNTVLEGNYYILTQFSGISHVTPDYPTVLRLGFKGLKKSAEKSLERLRKTQGESLSDKDELENKIAFYQAAVISADAAIEYGERWRTELEKLSEKTIDPTRKAELEELASIFANIPANPPRSFHEALQMVFVAHVIIHQESFQHGVSFGRMDQYLYPYYVKDLNEGKITPVKAAEILGCFICKAGELLPLFFDRASEYFSGLSSASGISLGGARADGSGGVNDLSYLILLAYDQTRLRQPNFHARIDDDTPSDFMRLCCETLKKGGGVPAFFNDNAIVPALKQSGLSEADALDYSIVGCVEWGAQGKSFPAAGAVFVNMAMALCLALHDGRFNGKQFGPRTGPAESLHTMDALLEAFRKQLANLLTLAARGNNAIEIAHARHRPTPFLSIVVDGCLESGTEINAGGARYNSTGCQGTGLADVIDSVVAIDQLVFKERKLSLNELMKAVDDNFERSADLRAYILNKVPKYGENAEPSDNYARIISGMFARETMKLANPRQGAYLAGFWTMTTHMGFGARTPALPGGRLAGDPLANGASPRDGRDRQGPTASLSSASNLDARLIANGCAVNQKLNPDHLKGETGNIILEGLISGYFAKGGAQIQFNIVDNSMLADAKARPEKYPDLVVRVSGYSAYFNDLTEAMKDELISRTSHRPGEGRQPA